MARGVWTAIWIMGNLARDVYPASVENVWPFTYDECQCPGPVRARATPHSLFHSLGCLFLPLSASLSLMAADRHLVALRNAMAVARALGRDLILPQLLCLCERAQSPWAHRRVERSPFASVRLPPSQSARNE